MVEAFPCINTCHRILSMRLSSEQLEDGPRPAQFGCSLLITAKSSLVAALTYLSYDHVITFDTEIAYVWKTPWSLGKGLFIFNRYFGLIWFLITVYVSFRSFLTNKVCYRYNIWMTTSAILPHVSTGCILVSRIHAVYNCNWKVTYITAGTQVISGISSVLLNFLNFPGGVAGPHGLPGCYFGRPVYFVWVSPLVGHTVLCLFMLHRAWRMYVQDGNSPLLHLIVRDSVLYFLTIFPILLFNCIVNFLGPPSGGAGFLWASAVTCAVGSRLLLNMREEHFRRQENLRGPEASYSLAIFRTNV
ncbi:hypothetical protein JB92DRAFT_3093043 [Gautieria morchelliformis]|nr:hypothetical protein JB92DRAFT_3093043 [Gautieria morchelliformis]